MGTFFSLSKSATSLSLNISEIALLLFGLLLTLGLIEEYSEADRWKRYVKVFEMFVILGVAGELLADGGIFLCSSHLQTISDLEVASLNVRANQAEASLGKAISDAESAKATARGFDSQIAGASARAAEANQKAEEERLERLKLEAIVAPRSLSLDQQRQIADACRKFHGHDVLVYSNALDGEAAALGGQIISALQSAHIVVADARGSGFGTGKFDTGVHVSGPKVEDEFISVLETALSKIGNLKPGPAMNPNARGGMAMDGGGQSFPAGTTFVTITVGVKPLPILPPPETTKSKTPSAK